MLWCIDVNHGWRRLSGSITLHAALQVSAGAAYIKYLSETPRSLFSDRAMGRWMKWIINQGPMSFRLAVIVVFLGLVRNNIVGGMDEREQVPSLES